MLSVPPNLEIRTTATLVLFTIRN